MLALRIEYSTFSRKTDAKIALLKEVLDKIRRGEEVDVDKVLGTGDEQAEQEWADGRVFYTLWAQQITHLGVIVIKHIEEEDRAWEGKDRKRERRRLKKEQATAEAAEETTATTAGDPASDDKEALPVQTSKPPKFL